MTDVIDDGGPAGRDYNVGISLRDYFAAWAPLQSIPIRQEGPRGPTMQEIACASYAWADAMIRARKSGTPS